MDHSRARPRALCQQGYLWADIVTAVRPAAGEDVTVVRPGVKARIMTLFLAHFAASLAEHVHAVLALDGGRLERSPAAQRSRHRFAGDPGALQPGLVPGGDAKRLSGRERVWFPFRERFLSPRVLDDTGAMIEACCAAWNALVTEPHRRRSPGAHPWLPEVSPSTRGHHPAAQPKTARSRPATCCFWCTSGPPAGSSARACVALAAPIRSA